MGESPRRDEPRVSFCGDYRPGTPLANMAQERSFREIIYGDPQVGGRYSALTAFGLFPAALLGMKIETLLSRADRMFEQCLPTQPAGRNPGLVLGILLGVAAAQGRDKLTFLADPELLPWEHGWSSWSPNQAVKRGGGLYRWISSQRLTLGIMAKIGCLCTSALAGQRKEEQAPISRRPSGDHFALGRCLRSGAEMYRWEVAVALACAFLHVNAFDQPDVEDSKGRARALLAAFQNQGTLPSEKAQWEDEHVAVFISQDMEQSGLELAALIQRWISQAEPGDYIAINAICLEMYRCSSSCSNCGGESLKRPAALRRWALGRGSCTLQGNCIRVGQTGHCLSKSHVSLKLIWISLVSRSVLGHSSVPKRWVTLRH